MDSHFKTIIGLEVHIEPNTVSKMFCGCPQDHFGKEPNTQTCPICMGLPGALPIANRNAIVKTITLGLALGCEISSSSRFYRKHYFYPDLPKSFQTSQKENPFCVGGELMGKKINHIHLEEDAGKLLHETINSEKISLVDFNRSGCALIELVTEPVFTSIEEVISFLKELQMIAKYLDISNADMEKGTMRLEANISLSLDGSLPDYKVELKNINSFKFLEKALKAEIKRQSEALSNNEKLVQETRGYDEVKEITYSQRSKEDSHDYRYFPEADLPPISFEEKEINKIRSNLPELPSAKRQRFISMGLSETYAVICTSTVENAFFADQLFAKAKDSGIDPKKAADLFINRKIEPKPENIINIIERIKGESQKKVISEDTLIQQVEVAISESQTAVSDYKKGKEQALQVILGRVMKLTKGSANPLLAMQIIKSKLTL